MDCCIHTPIPCRAYKVGCKWDGFTYCPLVKLWTNTTALTHVCWINKLIKNSHFHKWNVLEGSLFCFPNFCYWVKEIENFNISENYIISVKAAKIAGWSNDLVAHYKLNFKPCDTRLGDVKREMVREQE